MTSFGHVISSAYHDSQRILESLTLQRMLKNATRFIQSDLEIFKSSKMKTQSELDYRPLYSASSYSSSPKSVEGAQPEKERRPYFSIMYMVVAALILSSCTLSIDLFQRVPKKELYIISQSLFTRGIGEASSSSCRRFAFVKVSNHSGFGHRFGDLVLGYVLALETNSSYALGGPDVFSTRGLHGSYSWAYPFLGIHQLPVIDDLKRDSKDLTHLELGNWDHARYAGKCNVILEGCDRCCVDPLDPALRPKQWCFRTKVNAYNIAKAFFRGLFKDSKFLPSQNVFADSQRKREITIAWHVRVGDITIPYSESPRYFENVMDQIKGILDGHPHRLFVFSEKPLLGEKYNHIRKYDPIFINDLDVSHTLYHFIHADILVTSGSSFTAVAALLRDETKITLQSRLRGGQLRGIYEVSDHALLETDGTIVPASKIVVLRKRAQQMIQALHSFRA